MTNLNPQGIPKPSGPPRALLVGGLLVVLAGVVALALNLGARKTLSRAAEAPKVAQDNTSADLRKVNPSWVKWRQVALIQTQMKQPRGIALGPRGDLYVAGDSSVMVFGGTEGPYGSAGSRLEVFPRAYPPGCLAVDARGLVYLGFQDRVLGPSQTVGWFALGPRARITSVLVAGGNVWIGDAGNRVVLRCDMQGHVLSKLGKRDPARRIPGLVLPSLHLDLAWTRQGNLLVTNAGRLSVETYRPSGDLISSWGRASSDLDGFFGCCNPTNLAVLPDGKVVTAEKGLPRVKVYYPDGRLESVVAVPDDLSPGVVGLSLAVDAHGRIFVLDPGIRAVRVFARR